MDSKKIIAAAVVALFCMTAYACVITDDTDAASKKYELYVEILDEDHIAADYAYVYFESEADNQKYCEAATKALADAGYGDVTLEVGQYGVSVKYKGDISSSTWYSDGKVWKPVAKMEEDFINNTKAGAAVNGAWIDEETFEELPVTEQANWQADGQGHYQKKLEVPGTVGEIKNYTVYLTLINDDLVKYETTTIKFSAENTGTAWVFAFNQATKALGNSIFAKTNATYAEGMILILFGENGNTASWVKENGKWVSVQDTEKQYTADSEIDFELQNGWISKEQYSKLTEDQKKSWVAGTGMMSDFYQRTATAANSSSGGDLPIVYIVVAVVAIVLVACAAYYLVKKKNA